MPGGGHAAGGVPRAGAGDGHHLRLPRGDGRGPRGHHGSAQALQVRAPAHLAVLPAPGHARRAHEAGQHADGAAKP
eukprot:830178-Pyramimonas_sp.AAC.1